MTDCDQIDLTLDDESSIEVEVLSSAAISVTVVDNSTDVEVVESNTELDVVLVDDTPVSVTLSDSTDVDEIEVSTDIGPQGPQGEQGIQGIQGETGPPGTTDYTELENIPSEFPPEAHNHAHNGLTGLNTGDYLHLTAAQTTGLTGGGDTTLHRHADLYYDGTDKVASAVAANSLQIFGGVLQTPEVGDYASNFADTVSDTDWHCYTFTGSRYRSASNGLLANDLVLFFKAYGEMTDGNRTDAGVFSYQAAANATAAACPSKAIISVYNGSGSSVSFETNGYTGALSWGGLPVTVWNTNRHLSVRNNTATSGITNSWTAIVWGVAQHTGSNWGWISGDTVFTVPITGYYKIDWSTTSLCTAFSSTTDVRTRLINNGNEVWGQRHSETITANGQYRTMSGSILIYLAASDVISLQLSTNAATATVQAAANQCSFTIMQVNI